MEAESTAGAKKRQGAAPASASAAPYIPDEVVGDILARLPSRSVLHCRAVCKAWLRIVSCPEFALEHHRRQPAMPLVSFLRDAGGREVADVADCCVEALDLRADEFRSAVRFTDARERCGKFCIRGSCDGLLLLTFGHRAYVCNPATHQWTRLPKPLPSSKFAAFYRHEPTGEYRALFYRRRWPGTDYYILVADKRKGRGIGLRSKKDVFKFKECPAGPPALYRGILHWRPQRPHAPRILAFNTVTEVFGWLRPPPALIREHMSLLEVEDKLAMLMCGKDATMFELWLMKDYGKQAWVPKLRIELSAMAVSTFNFDEPWSVFFMSEEGFVLVNQNSNKLGHYDLNGKLKEGFRCDGRLLKITPYTLKESLIRHSFFETQADGNGDERSPPFFRGL